MHAYDLFDNLEREIATLELQKNQTARQEALVNERKRQVRDLEGRLDNARATTRAILAEQQKLQDAVIKADRTLRDANAKNLELTESIQKLEELK